MYPFDKSSLYTLPLLNMKYYLYTDGSANNFSPYGEGGYAFIVTNQNKQIITQFSEGELHATNNTMELKAIINGCKSIKENGAKVIVVSDSQYALNVLSGKWKAKTNLELIEEHIENSQRLNIVYTWVKGHNGDELNEMADQLAQDETFKIRQQYGIPVFDCKNSPKVQSKNTKQDKKKNKSKTSQSFYIHIETQLIGERGFGSYSIFDNIGMEYKTDVREYWSRTEPRLKLMTLCQALLSVPSNANVVITPSDSYMQFALSRITLKPNAYNADIIDNLRKERRRMSKIEFKNIVQTVQDNRALEALCDYVGHIK